MNADTDTEMRQRNIRIPEILDDEIDDTWRRRGFASKSEFVRHALRTAVGPAELAEETLAITEETEWEFERGEPSSHDELQNELTDG